MTLTFKKSEQHCVLVSVAVFLSLVGITLLIGGCAKLFSLSPSPQEFSSYELKIVKERQVTTTPGISEYPNSWSPDGKYLAATIFAGKVTNYGDAPRDGIYIEIFDASTGQSRRLLPMGLPSVRDFFPIWSPDGKRLVFFSKRSGNLDIWSIKSNGSDLKQLTTDTMEDLYGTWSPDGDRIAFLSTRSKEVAIWTMKSDGSDHRQLTAGGNGDWDASWSPDGARIVFGSSRLSGLNEPKGDQLVLERPRLFERILVGDIPSEAIWIVDVQTRSLKKLMPEEETGGLHWYPAWSQDGMKIAYIADDAGSMDIWIMDYDGAHPTQLTTSHLYEVFPAWSPDGDLLAFASARNSRSITDIRIATLKKEPR